MLLPPRIARSYPLLAVCLVALGCQAKIGDDCAIGTDCSQTGSRACDTSLPGGYCTVFNCEPDSCPEEAACIGFMTAPSTLSSCLMTTDTRQTRNFCMRNCGSASDCRTGYDCVDLNREGNPWGASLMDVVRTNSKVCVLPYAALPANKNKSAQADYCTAGSYEDSGYFDVAPSSGGAGNSSSAPEGAAAGGAAAGNSGSATSTGGTSADASAGASSTGLGGGGAATSG